MGRLGSGVRRLQGLVPLPRETLPGLGRSWEDVREASERARGRDRTKGMGKAGSEEQQYPPVSRAHSKGTGV